MQSLCDSRAYKYSPILSCKHFWSFAFQIYVHLALHFIHGVSHNLWCDLNSFFPTCKINILNSPSSPTDLPRQISIFYIHLEMFGSLSHFIASFASSWSQEATLNYHVFLLMCFLMKTLNSVKFYLHFYFLNFWAVLSLRCCMLAFSSWSEWRLLSSYGAQASHCGRHRCGGFRGFSYRLSSYGAGGTCVPCIGRWILNPWPPGRSERFSSTDAS